MPMRLTEFPATPGEDRYYWDAILDGSTWELTAGNDFSGEATTFATNARHQASGRGGRIRIRHYRDEEPERIVIQFRAD